jgi:nitroimidazol reductase NimA-like FMN-containing flavoprotein (pyridoxamine 5'-phosphate oxidase superfamily)
MTSELPPATEELSLHTCWAMLRETPVGRLAVTTDEGPDIFPINFVVDGGSIVFRTAAGTKLSAANRQRVAFEADGYDASLGTAWSVVVKGRAVPVATTDESIDVHSLPLLPWQHGNKPWFIRIVPATVTGRRIHVGGGLWRSVPAPT